MWFLVVGRGYVEFVRELQSQLEGGKVTGVKHFDEIVMACGRWVLLESTRTLSFYAESFFSSSVAVDLTGANLEFSPIIICLQWGNDSRACIGCLFEQP